MKRRSDVVTASPPILRRPARDVYGLLCIAPGGSTSRLLPLRGRRAYTTAVGTSAGAALMGITAAPAPQSPREATDLRPGTMQLGPAARGGTSRHPLSAATAPDPSLVTFARLPLAGPGEDDLECDCGGSKE
jgi:hypothetical protein